MGSGEEASDQRGWGRSERSILLNGTVGAFINQTSRTSTRNAKTSTTDMSVSDMCSRPCHLRSDSICIVSEGANAHCLAMAPLPRL